jgi:DNA-binding NtrC family response regulator
VFTASSSEEAMERAGAVPDLDVMVLDINLPDGFGSSLALALRQVQPESRVVYMSGYARHDPILQQGIEEHMVFLDKPFTIADLAATIRKVMATG